jgi:phenylalanyl-tRNA synthetase beta chain
MIGKADLMEEIARIYGYDRIPETNLADGLPVQVGNRELDMEENIRDHLVGLGLQEIVTYRFTSPDLESRALPPEYQSQIEDYVEVANPISSDKSVMRQNILASMLDVVVKNYRSRDHIALFEIGPEIKFSQDKKEILEINKLTLCVSGMRDQLSWQNQNQDDMDFYDLKGRIEALLMGLHISGVDYVPEIYPSFHPGKSARMEKDGKTMGYLGEIHPLVVQKYKLPDKTLTAAVIDLKALINEVDDLYAVESIPDQPPVLEDLALVVKDDLPAQDVQKMIEQTGGKILREVRLFDVYYGDQVGEGKKSLAYSLVYQDLEKTLTDKEVLAIRNKIVKRLEKELGAKLRSW